MYKVYYLVSPSTSWYYIGMTMNRLQTRLIQHKSCAKRGVKSPLYDAMRKYKDYIIVLKDNNLTHKECCDREIELIAEAKELGHNILNLAVGGNGGFVIPEDKLDEWKAKLSKKRQGKKPALGMKHTEANKKLFSEVSRKYWETQATYNAAGVTAIPFKEAKEKYGISKTHYYRLKRSLSSDQ